jgi:Tripartite tricarboxylate transporter family receptor
MIGASAPNMPAPTPSRSCTATNHSFSSLSGAHSFVQSKQAKALAVSSSFRVRTFPDVPTVSETGIADYAVNGWYGRIDGSWPKAEKPLRCSISSGHWGTADAICSL